ncbi:MAG: protein kinase [Burkholderiales bacterium]|nr:protein kinase [Burkholderiales bacterium]
MKTSCKHCGGQIVDAVCEDCGRAAGNQSLLSGEPLAAATAVDGDVATTARTVPTARNSVRFTVNYPSRKASGGTTKTSRRIAGKSTHTSARRAALGGGLLSLPDMPSQDPLKLLMAVPEVPEHKRHCPKCDAKVNRTKGFCPACGTQYDFEPKLKPGDVVTGKYEVKGPIAFGGLGWIYLGWDTVLSRWVVLKGLLNANDEASANAAVAERQFLAAVKHPKIVGIYDFVNHQGEGYIIMEYVGGITVHSLRKQRGPLPVDEAIAYILGVLPALAYLHAQGMVYCDFKPDNIMLEGGDIKLIDMGAVRKIGDINGDIYGTVGFMAPEADDDPRAVSDLYTIGRALATLVMDFKFASDYVDALPTPDEAPILAEHESFYRFLLRATHIDPDERFQTADEMADQLFGVLREIVALKTEPKPADSKVFTGDSLFEGNAQALGDQEAVLALPRIRLDMGDRAASEVLRAQGLPTLSQRIAELKKVMERYKGRAAEPILRLTETYVLSAEISADARQQVEGWLQQRETEDPFDWRVQWLRGLFQLRTGSPREAMASFERVYFEMPGEIAPRLAMGVAAEQAGLHDLAIQYYDRVSRVDPAYVSAAFGLARSHAAQGALSQMVEALLRVPTTHSLRTAAMHAICEQLLEKADRLDLPLVTAAEAAVATALPEGGRGHQLAARLLNFVVTRLQRQPLDWPKGKPFLGLAFADKALREAAEAQYRKAANLADDVVERIHWVTEANRVRPVTLF